MADAPEQPAQPEIPEVLLRYFEQRQRDRLSRVHAMWGRLGKRTQKLVAEAAVMAYVQGTMRPNQPIPNNSEIVTMTFDACCSMPDLYPAISRLARPPRPRPTPPETP